MPICGPGSTPTVCVPTYHGKQPASFGAAISMAVAPGPDLGFVVLSSTGVSNVPKISINGNVGKFLFKKIFFFFVILSFFLISLFLFCTGVAPAALTYITAFALIDEGNYGMSVPLASQHFETYVLTCFLFSFVLFLAKSYEVNSNGKVYGADTAGSQTPLAVNYMVTAYNDAAQLTADFAECGAVSLILFPLRCCSSLAY